MKPDARTGNRVQAAVHRMMMAARCWTVGLGLAALGCSDSPQPVTIEVYTWWEAPSEQKALDVIAREHERAHPHVDIITTESDGSASLRRELTGELMAGVPPATFQANVGADLLQWAALERGVSSVDDEPAPERARIASLSGKFKDEELWDDLPEPLREALLIDGEPYAVPINIHQVNRIYYNPRKVTEFEQAHGKNLLDIETLCPENRDGELGVPIAIGYDQPFTLTHLTFENILVARKGPRFYDDLFRGRQPSGWQQAVKDALECVQYLSRSFLRPTLREAGNDTSKVDLDAYRGWSEALGALGRNAAFTVAGDWADGELVTLGLEDEVESREFPRPPGERVFVFTSDTFPLPVRTAHPDEALALLRTIAADSVQVAFSAEKGSIKARTPDAFNGVTPVLATSGLLPHYYPLTEDEGLEDRLHDMVQPDAGEEEVEAALRLFIDAEPLLRRWQGRLHPETQSP